MNPSMSTMRSLAFFGSLGLTLASIACSAAAGGTASNTMGTGSTGNVVGSTGGSNYNPGAVTSDVLQTDGTFLLQGTIRDFNSSFPDMEPHSHNAQKLNDIGAANIEENNTPSDTSRDCTKQATINGVTYKSTCIVGTTLDANNKPTYAGPAGGTITTTGAENFNLWYNDDPNHVANMRGDIALVLNPKGDGTYEFTNNAFFPIDGQLLDANNDQEDSNGGNPPVYHNYHFTTEFHLQFTYLKGQLFTFAGDDDLFVFINGQLVVDCGGIHASKTVTLELDKVPGLTPSQDYDFYLFYNERHVTASDLTISTSMKINKSVVVN